MITNDKLLAFPERIEADKRPITADLFLTRRCNNACGYCTYTRHMRRSGPEMSEELFDRTLVKLIALGVKGVILTGGGEPTVAGCFSHATSSLELLGMPYGINTNLNKYVECKPAYLKVSLDGWDEDSYEASRGVRAYHRVRENIEAFWHWKQDNSPETKLVIQMVAKTSNDVAKFYEANRSLPCDTMVFRPIESRLGEWYSGVSASPVLDAVRSIDDDRVILNPKFTQLREFFDDCHASHLQIAVDECANVIYCCHKPYEVVGSVFDDDILEKKLRYATDMSMCDAPCRLTSSNLLVRRVAELEKMTDTAFI